MFHKVQYLEFLYQNGYLNDFIWSSTGPDYEPDDGPLSEEQLEQVKETAMKFVDLGEHPKDHDEKAVEEPIVEKQLPEPDPVQPVEPEVVVEKPKKKREKKKDCERADESKLLARYAVDEICPLCREKIQLRL